MAQQHTFERLVSGTFAVEKLVLGDGTRILSGAAAPVSGVTGKGRAGKGSLYIRTTAGNPQLFENAGTKQAPVWQSLVGGLE